MESKNELGARNVRTFGKGGASSEKREDLVSGGKRRRSLRERRGEEITEGRTGTCDKGVPSIKGKGSVPLSQNFGPNNEGNLGKEKDLDPGVLSVGEKTSWNRCEGEVI